MNKRGQELSTNAIILIILAIVVLVVLILGFTVGWGKIAPWISSTNVDSLVTQCGTACSTNSLYDFCSAKRNLNSEGTKLKEVTCYYLAEKQTKYGISKCSSLACDEVFVEVLGTEKLEDKCTGNEGKTIAALVNNKLETYDCVAL